jgi:chromosome condensin MukBEF ATPase and DNA-binding subunit MukB
MTILYEDALRENWKMRKRIEALEAEIAAAMLLRVEQESALPEHYLSMASADTIRAINAEAEVARLKAQVAELREALERIKGMFTVSLGVAGLNGNLRISEIYDTALASLDKPEGN